MDKVHASDGTGMALDKPGAEASTMESSETLAFLRAEFELLEHMRESLVNLVNQRFNFLLALVSAALVAMSFLGNQLHFSTVFFLIASGLLVSILLLGIIVFARALEAEVMTIIYIRGLNRIRNYYVTNAPAISDYLTMPWYDDVPSFYAPGYDLSKAGGTWWTTFTNLPAMIAVINSTLVSFLGVSISQFVIQLDSNVGSTLEEPLPYLVLSGAVSLVSFAIALYLQVKRITTRLSQATARFHVHFKSPKTSNHTRTE
ncbi:MAG TPA: hypothetical protein VGE04_01385 [Chloroflexia bacterium]|jgi:hypothetical protein